MYPRSLLDEWWERVSRSRSWSRSWCECEEVRRGGLGLNQDIVADFVRKERYYGSIDFCVGTERDLFAMLRREWEAWKMKRFLFLW